MAEPDDLHAILQAERADDILETEEHPDGTDYRIRPTHVRTFLTFLRDDPRLNFAHLTDVCGIDYLGLREDLRLGVVYHLNSFERNERIRVKAGLADGVEEIDSIHDLFPAANWGEREAHDMYGIHFKGHPDLPRMLMPDDYPGFPLRKEHPLKGEGYRLRFQRYNTEPGE